SPGNPDAVSDTLVTIPSATITDKIELARILFQDPPTADHLYWSTGVSKDGSSIIALAGEFKKDENDTNMNQAIMALATAQAQRKALGLKDSIVMGAIASRGRVQILSSYRISENSSVFIYPHKQMFDLSEPSQLIHLYVFFSKLERDSRGTLTSELRTWELPTETSIKGNKWQVEQAAMVVLWMRMDSMVVLLMRMDLTVVTSTWTS
ncbi:hypothetical protein K443DRAFT_103778, partial [Laccaria amethystina LaAM-08-1]